MIVNYALFIRLINNALFSIENEVIPCIPSDHINWNSVARESVAQSVTALAYEAAKKAANADARRPVGAGSHPRPRSEESRLQGKPVSPDGLRTLQAEVDHTWKNPVNSVIRRNIRVEAEHAEPHRLLSGNYAACHSERSEGSPPDPLVSRHSERSERSIKEKGPGGAPSSAAQDESLRNI